jgi:zinc transport system substrate-binding protein
MNMNKYIGLLAALLLIVTGCGKKQQQDQQKNLITVSILPQKYFVEQIAGDRFEVNVMIPPGANPVTYDPAPSQMQKVEQSSAYIRVGYLVFERAWMDKIKGINPEMEVFDQSEGVDLIRNASHHHAGEKGIDPHIWTSPKAVKKQVQNIGSFLTRLDPANQEDYEENTRQFLARIDSLDRMISSNLQGLEGSSFLIFHPALSYFARDYGLNQISLEHEGKEPSPSRLKEVIERAEASHIEAVFVQQQFSTDEAETLARELNAEVVRIDPLAHNWFDNMKSMSHAIVEALKDKGQTTNQ